MDVSTNTSNTLIMYDYLSILEPNSMVYIGGYPPNIFQK